MAESMPQGSVTFEEVAICFSPEEWALLADWQKDLYKDVMRDNHEMLNSLDLAAHKPDLILRIERGEEPCAWRLRSSKAREGLNRTFTEGHIQIKKESCFNGDSAGQPCHAVHPEALKRTLGNGEACGFSPWLGSQFSTSFCMDGTALLPPWPTELRWPNCPVVGQQPASVAFQVGHLRVSGGHFGPVDVAGSHPGSQEEMLLICTQCQKCFLAPLPHHLSSMASTRQVAQVCSECETRKAKGAPSAGAQQRPAVASPCPCAHCLAAPNLRQRVPKEERPYKCGKCDKSFRFAHEHTWHQKVHAGEKIYKCHQCEKVFRHRQELMWHQRTHTPEWPHKCSACEKSFRFKQELTWHLKTHSVERPYKCPECEKSFRFKQEFMWHQRAHVGDRPYKCPECEKSFRFKQEFTWHQRSHASEKTYKCPGCDKSFRYKQEFVWHQRIHTGEQPYPCASCNSTFTCRQEYMRHQRLHDGEKPYQCPHCDKTFRRGSTLIRHRRIHTGEAAFKCLQCDRSFGQSAHLIKHQRMHAVKHEPAEKEAGWAPCLQDPGVPVQQEAVNVLSLKAVSVGALLVLNLQEPKQEKDLEGQSRAWEPQM